VLMLARNAMRLKVKILTHTRVFPVLSLLAAIGLALALGACTDTRNATTPGELFHCASSADCLNGWACHCGYCQQPEFEQLACGVTDDDVSSDAVISLDTATGLDGSDTASQDAGSDGVDLDGIDVVSVDVAAGTPIGVCNQGVSSDVIFASCNLDTWQGCPAGYGCYYAPALKQTLCKPHATMVEAAKCDPCQLTECGAAADAQPLICDSVDKICRRTCDATVPVKAGQCPSGEQCYQLVDDKNVKYPSTGGICAP
jgi:hypothetical protein